jgi:septation ring formation regulator EzrA
MIILLTLLIISIVVYVVAKVLTNKTINEIEKLQSSNDEEVKLWITKTK